MRSFRTKCVLVPVAAVALLAAGCVADDLDPKAAEVPPGGTIEIVMSEFDYRPASLAFVAGSTVKVTLINDGSVTHEFMAGRARAAGGGYDNDLLAVVLSGADGSEFSTAGVMLGSDEHAEEPMADDHEAEPMADDHEADEMADEHAEEPMTDAEMAAMDVGGHAHSGAAFTVEPFGRVELELLIPADVSGNWGFGCFIKGHYEAGMHGTMTVMATTS